jgi:colanic acid/amylovoran biosynthesis glycosyltransferase
VVGHVIREYLPRSQTFVHTLLMNHRRFRPVVFAGKTSNLGEFPLDGVLRVGTDAQSLHRRAAGGLLARAHGAAGAYEHRLLRELTRRECVLLHAHFGPTACRHLEIMRKAGLPLVTTFYGFDLGLARGEDSAWRAAYARLFAEGDAFVCEGPRMAEHLASLGCPAEKVTIVKIGLDLSRIPFRPRARTEPLILFQTGRFVEKKAVDVSIRAFAAAERRLGPCELWLVGDGPERKRLEALAAELGAASRVRFLGMLSHADYRRAMDTAHIGLQPSRTARDGDTEGGAPTVLLEMQAAGMPVIGTRHADLPAVVAEQDALVDEDDVDALAEAIVQAVELSEPDWNARCERGRALMESEHDARHTTASMEALYSSLVRTQPEEAPRYASGRAPA